MYYEGVLCRYWDSFGKHVCLNRNVLNLPGMIKKIWHRFHIFIYFLRAITSSCMFTSFELLR